MSRVVDLLFPPICAGCGDPVPYPDLSVPPEALCPACRKAWNEARAELCVICGKPVSECNCVPEALTSAGCDSFRKLVFYRPGNRNEVQNRVIYRIKDRADSAAVAFLARELSEAIRETLNGRDVGANGVFLTYLPRGKRAVAKSGTDQAKELATALSQRLEIPLYRVISRRFWHSKPQKLLSTADRKKNAKAAFRIRPSEDIRGKCAILVDDIVTSGASMSAAVRLLRREGVKQFLSVAVASDENNRQPVAKQRSLEGELDRIYLRTR